ncbi:uncharacterized protein B0I36DRAFT_164751 [Microdochium trichocladiopsis]|uniref:Transcription factor domain-containing protein n=1 Tax=Microdochium trichocladiopsis TaxID=1682393 RepID=A0A9P8Y117_9PEZI|nr:uncharacterized protein B0I36DRAFT_164751 [Microdochium trichocladiopsis]KAH7024876.1 hypothetical protein B0I36DRAFT_164751 [Microdochium trichocladiopsis]
MIDAKPPCGRCRKKRLPCAVSRNLQVHMEYDTLWKQEIEHRIRQLEAKLAEASSATAPGQEGQVLMPQAAASNLTNISNAVSSSSSPPAALRHNTAGSVPVSSATGLSLVVDLESSPGSLPGLRLHSNTQARPAAPPQADFVSRGVVSLENAVKYQAVYQERLDHFLYGVLGDRSGYTFEQLHRQSPILSTAVCAVGALHAASADYEPLRLEFAALATAASLSRKNDADHVRALCIGAFWMSDLSSALSSLAVRIATELQLHRSFARAIQGDYQSYLHARLYYLVYACDHHLSIPHGRPPLTRECEAIKNVRRFLSQCPLASRNADDRRLVSHVLRWTVWTETFDLFGQNVDVALTDAQIQTAKRLGHALDTIRIELGETHGPDDHVGNYPRKGAIMQYHFAKLFLCSHAFRSHESGGCGGPQQQQQSGTGSGYSNSNGNSNSSDVQVDVYELASSAVLAASCILRTLTSDPEVQSFLNGLPTYFHVMIAFAVVFLLKVSSSSSPVGTETARHAGFCKVDAEEVQALLGRTIAVLQEVVRTMHPQHLLVSITEGATDAVQRISRVSRGGGEQGGGGRRWSSSPAAAAAEAQQHDSINVMTDSLPNDEMFDEFFNSYDFLVDHS